MTKLNVCVCACVHTCMCACVCACMCACVCAGATEQACFEPWAWILPLVGLRRPAPRRPPSLQPGRLAAADPLVVCPGFFLIRENNLWARFSLVSCFLYHCCMSRAQEMLGCVHLPSPRKLYFSPSLWKVSSKYLLSCLRKARILRIFKYFLDDKHIRRKHLKPHF